MRPYLFFLALLFSCTSAPNPDAKNLCGCYTLVFRAYGDEAEKLNDSCMTIYKNILGKYKDDPKGMSEFSKSYADCQ
ncbi:MAG: hypothetical protein ACK4K0_05875 [Flavobacteriales bacterium]